METSDFMSDNLNKILMLEQNIQDFINENTSLSDLEFEEKFYEKGYVERVINILKKLNSKDIIEVIKRCRYLWYFVDLKKFMKKYPINKTFLRNNKDMYIEEYRNLQKTCYSLSNISNDAKEFQDYMSLLNVDDTEKYLLTNMPNDQIYSLANSTGMWDEKLYFFSFFKENER